ncbi:MAG TPA: hypothetical protein VFX16_07875 [Pseudonocardiaceae bacterium]|nr:hypothetical protein [Pseudonocardiaceae bacterium]
MPKHRIARLPKWARSVLRVVLVGCIVFVAVVGWSIGTTLAAPGSDSVSARLAEWSRDHGLGSVVTWLERQQYQHHQPVVGGTPAGGIPSAAGAEPTPTHRTTGLPAPPPITTLAAGPPLPGEGQWQTVVTVHGQPAVRVAELRPDAVHTSYVAGVLWLDPTYVSGQLNPGYHDPGGTWHAPTSLTPALQRTVVAVFNGGFRLNGDSHGGYYSEGRTVLPLVNDAASLVLRTDGTATVGSWNREVRMSSAVASVRQNLVLLVDNGIVNPTCQSGGPAEWGRTIGQAAYIDRSGFGVTATGAEVYVGGPALSVCTLGRLLRAAGVVRGMELDINPSWVTGAYFHDSPTGAPHGYQLFPGEQKDPQHYLTPSSRDWYAWYARPTPLTRPAATGVGGAVHPARPTTGR